MGLWQYKTMNIQRLTYPNTTIITLQEAKDHLRVTSNDEDMVILDCIKSATNLIETYTGQYFLSGSCVAYLDTNEFSSYSEVKIWAYPVNEITSVKYLDTNGTEQTFASSNYSTDISSSPARILSTTIPSVKSNTLNTIRIYFNVGHLSKESIDPELLGWVKIFTAFFYQTRQPEYSGFTVAEIAYKYQAALDKYRKDPII